MLSAEGPPAASCAAAMAAASMLLKMTADDLRALTDTPAISGARGPCINWPSPAAAAAACALVGMAAPLMSTLPRRDRPWL